MSACNLTTPIPGDECIGASRSRINTNFDTLDTTICNLRGTNITLTGRVAITETDIANLLNTAITLNTNILALSTTLSNSSKGFATAWVNFKGTDVNVGNNAQIYDSYNVASVTRLANFSSSGTTGFVYQINFNTPMNNKNYAITGTTSVGGSSVNSDDQLLGIQSYNTNTLTSFRIAICDSNNRNVTETGEIISVVVHGGK
jgi:hypothetical protein